MDNKTAEPQPIAWWLFGGTDVFLASEFTPAAEHRDEWVPLYRVPVAKHPQQPPPKGSLSHIIDTALVSHGTTLLSFESPAEAVEFLLAAERKLAVDLEQEPTKLQADAARWNLWVDSLFTADGLDRLGKLEGGTPPKNKQELNELTDTLIKDKESK